jgi:hypothetical protein
VPASRPKNFGDHGGVSAISSDAVASGVFKTLGNSPAIFWKSKQPIKFSTHNFQINLKEPRIFKGIHLINQPQAGLGLRRCLAKDLLALPWI